MQADTCFAVVIFAFLLTIRFVVECAAATIEIFAADTAITVRENGTTLHTEDWQGGGAVFIDADGIAIAGKNYKKTAKIRAFALLRTPMHRTPTPAAAPFIAGNLWRHLINMTLARSVGILATFIVDFVDILFISRLDDAHLIAGMGFAAAALYFIRAVAIALGITTTVLVARAIGSGDRHRAARYAWDTSAFSFLLLTLLAALAWFAREPILTALGARGASLHHAADYLAIVLIGLPLLALGNCGTSTLFALGSARLAMYVSLSATAAQAVLDPIFIFVCGWGLQGAALASLAAQMVLVVAAWYVVIWRYRLRAPLCLRLLLLNIPAIIAIAVPAVLTNLTSPLATAYAARQMAPFGDDAVAAFAVIIRLVPVGFALLFSLSAAVAPIVGQNAGAAPLAHGPAFGRVFEQAGHGGGKGVRIAGGHQQAIDAIEHHGGQVAHAGGDHRQFGGQVLVDLQGREIEVVLGRVGCRGNVHLRQQSRNLMCLHGTGEAAVLQQAKGRER